MIKISDIKNFNLKETVICGQIFRFSENTDSSYTIVLSNRVINIRQEKDTLYIKSNNYDNLKEIIMDYFDLNRDYNKINEELIKKDKKLENIINSCIGFKIIRQSYFETIISYIISANNNVSRISNSINKISEKWGSEVIFEDNVYYLFPTPNQLKDATVDDFRNMGVGFRDRAVYEFVNKVNNNEIDINEIYNMNSSDATNILTQNRGIGPKVASCILLMAYNKLDVYPIDTWVKKAFLHIYNTDNVVEITKLTNELFNEYSGLVIQYMYHYMRNISNK